MAWSDKFYETCKRLDIDPDALDGRLVSVPAELLQSLIENTYELRGERAWWADDIAHAERILRE